MTNKIKSKEDDKFSVISAVIITLFALTIILLIFWVISTSAKESQDRIYNVTKYLCNKNLFAFHEAEGGTFTNSPYCYEINRGVEYKYYLYLTDECKENLNKCYLVER